MSFSKDMIYFYIKVVRIVHMKPKECKIWNKLIMNGDKKYQVKIENFMLLEKFWIKEDL